MCGSKKVASGKRTKEILLIGAFFLIGYPFASAFGYEPTINEIYVKQHALANFCDKADNGKRYDICERFKKVRKKLPKNAAEYDILRSIYNQTQE